jgi:hypothetical protein
MIPHSDTGAVEAERRTLRTWFKRIGLLGFLFFLLKGLAWLIAPALLIGNCGG